MSHALFVHKGNNAEGKEKFNGPVNTLLLLMLLQIEIVCSCGAETSMHTCIPCGHVQEADSDGRWGVIEGYLAQVVSR